MQRILVEGITVLAVTVFHNTSYDVYFLSSLIGHEMIATL